MFMFLLGLENIQSFSYKSKHLPCALEPESVNDNDVTFLFITNLVDLFK